MEAASNAIAVLQRWGARLGPYLMIEILVPGGTLLAVSLYLFRRYTMGQRLLARVAGWLPQRPTALPGERLSIRAGGIR